MATHQSVPAKGKKPQQPAKRASVPATGPKQPHSLLQQPGASPASLTPDDLSQLQQTIGNQALGRYVGSAANATAVSPAMTASSLRRMMDNQTAVAGRAAKQSPTGIPPIQRQPAPELIQRTELDGMPDALSDRLNPKNFAKSTYQRTATRGESLSTIDKWLKAAAAATTWDAQQYALVQVAAAADHWLQKHGPTAVAKEKSSVSFRRESVRAAAAEARYYTAKSKRVSASPGGPAPEKPEVENDGHETEIAEGVFDAIASGSGITGDFADRGAVELASPNVDTSNKMDTAGSGSINSSKFDILEGANVITGGMGLYSAFKDIEDPEKDGWEKMEAFGKGMSSTGQIIHGGYKAAKGIAIESGGDATSWTQVGDIGAAYADGTAFFAGFLSILKSAHDMRETSKMGGMTGYEKAESGLEMAGTVVGTIQSGVKTGLDITKAVTEAGASEAMAALSTTAGALGIVTGTIEFALGGLKLYRGYATKGDIVKAEAKQRQIVNGVQTGAMAAYKAYTEGLVGDPIALYEQLQTLAAVFVELKAASDEYAPAMAAVKKIENRRMEDGAFKMAKGTTAIVAGALIVSGVGAPIGIAVAALGGILALGQAGLKLSRNMAASRLTLVARRLTEDGIPKGRPDRSPGYREMEKRVYKCYFNHLPEVLEKRAPAGLSSSEFGDVKNFAWEDKKERVASRTKTIINSTGAAKTVDESQRYNTWLEVQDQQGKATHKEKPKGTTKAGLLTSGSAHKSKQAMEASKDDIVNALYKLGASSFNIAQQAFVDAPIIPVGNVDPETLAEFGHVTLQALLSAADIRPSRWAAWLAKSGGDEAEMKKLIRGKIG